MKNIHVPLPEDLHAVLMADAKASGESATSIVRQGIAAILREREHARIRAEMRAFAEEYAGTAWDLDPELEEAGLEFLRENP